MKKLGDFLGLGALVLAGGTAVLAVFALVNLVVDAVKAPAASPGTEQIAAVTEAAPGAAPEAEPAAADPASGSEAPAGADATAPAEPAAVTEVAATAPVAAVAGLAGDPTKGEAVFRKCKACHTIDAGGPNRVGPNLWGVVGRDVASHEGFAYSDALQGHAGESWTPEFLNSYLENPKTAIPGNKMSFAGLPKEGDRNDLIAWMSLQSDTPPAGEDAGAVAAGAAAVGAAVAVAAADAPEAAEPEAEVAVEIDPVPWPEGVTYSNPAERTAEEQAEIDARVAALKAEVDAGIDYERARFHPLHFPPAAQEASNAECLVCHQEILDHTPRAESPAGVSAEDTIAWYQTLDTYEGDQASFHYRHLESDFAKEVMNLECTFCHKANDPREESPDMLRSREAFTAELSPEFTLRKMVNPSETCLRCHGDFPDPAIMGLAGPWNEVRADMEWPEAPNGCLSCHAETFRTVRHAVDYLNALNIEESAREGSSDTCYGCHGGRQWYRIQYPYPRHPWPMMFDEETPEWAVDRPTQSDPHYAAPTVTVDEQPAN